jgi:hypothetical protein
LTDLPTIMELTHTPGCHLIQLKLGRLSRTGVACKHATRHQGQPMSAVCPAKVNIGLANFSWPSNPVTVLCDAGIPAAFSVGVCRLIVEPSETGAAINCH